MCIFTHIFIERKSFIMSIITKIFGTRSDRQIKKMMPVVDKIEALSDSYAAMSEAELRGVTAKLKERLAAGETLDDILPDAFAAVREASFRVLGKKHYRVQLIGGIVLQAVGVYDFLYKYLGSGISVPIIGFGASLAKGAIYLARTVGFAGAFAGGLVRTAYGVGVAVVASYLVTLFFAPKSK